MRKFLVFFFLLLLSNIQAQIIPHELLPPKPANAKPIVDDAGLLNIEEQNALSRKLVAYNDSTSNQIVIVTVKSLHGYASDQFATEIGHYWGVGGQSKKDNGVVILLSTGTEEGNKRKVFIATGYGLEGALPSITCKRIINAEMVPYLKAGAYYEAFDNAINAIIKAAAGEYKAPEGYAKKKKEKSGNIWFFIMLAVVAIILMSRRGGGGGMMSRRGWGGGIAETLFWASLLSGGGNSGSNSGNSNNDADGGGFGDFGGGDFGGGGAGSDW